MSKSTALQETSIARRKVRKKEGVEREKKKKNT